MKVKNIKSFEMAGFSVRTKTSDEYDILTSKIGKLWQKFFTDASSLPSENSKVYSVYTNYESDATGEYDVIVGANILIGSNLSLIKTVKVEAGKFLVFSAKGEMPNMCIKLWKEIWEYFKSEDCKYERTFIADFEVYKSFAAVDIYISIK